MKTEFNLKCISESKVFKYKLENIDKYNPLYEVCLKEKIEKSEVEEALSNPECVDFDHINDYDFYDDMYIDVTDCDVSIEKVTKTDEYLILYNITIELDLHLSTPEQFEKYNEEPIDVSDDNIIDIVKELKMSPELINDYLEYDSFEYPKTEWYI